MNINRSRCLTFVLTVAFFCSLHTAFSSSRDADEHDSQNLFLVIGQIQDCLHIHWRDQSTNSTSKSWRLPDGSMAVRSFVRMPLMHMAFTLKNHEIFALSGKDAVRMNTDRQIVLILGRRRGMMTEARFAEAAERLVSQEKRFLYYAERFQAPEGLIKKYKLENSVLFQDQDKDMPKLEGTREFDLELKKHGITLSRPETNIVSQIPAGALHDLPINAEGGSRQPDEPAPE